jgi:hypothetical protein
MCIMSAHSVMKVTKCLPDRAGGLSFRCVHTVTDLTLSCPLGRRGSLSPDPSTCMCTEDEVHCARAYVTLQRWVLHPHIALWEGLHAI